jgi:hypothetical protein
LAATSAQEVVAAAEISTIRHLIAVAGRQVASDAETCAARASTTCAETHLISSPAEQATHLAPPEGMPRESADDLTFSDNLLTFHDHD